MMGKFYMFKLGFIGVCLLFLANTSVTNGDVRSINQTNSKSKRQSANNLVFYQANGTPGVDFPVLANIPRTTFSCKNVDAGYYADLETDCQVFHICDEGRKMSFLCPNGTIFEQSELICEWWFKVNCSKAPSLYQESAEILQRENAKRKASRRVGTDWGTKQGVFPDSSELFGSSGDYKTPARFVTPSYVYSTITPKTYKEERGGRKLKNSDQGNTLVAQSNYNTVSTTPQYQSTPRITFSVKSQSIINPPESQKTAATQNRPYSYNGNSNFAFKNTAPTFAPFEFSFPTRSSTNRNDIRLPAGFSHNENSRKTSTVKSYGGFSITSKPENKNQLGSSEESQEPQESASFVKSSFNSLQNVGKSTTVNPYFNHQSTYSEIKDPRYYYPKPQNRLPDKPFVGSTVDSAILSTIPVSASKDSTTEFVTRTSATVENKETSIISDKPLNVEIEEKFETTTMEIPIKGSGQFSSIRIFSTPKPKGKSLNPDLRFNDYSSSTARAPFKITVIKPDNSISDDILNKKFEPTADRTGKSFTGTPSRNQLNADKNTQVLLDVSNKNEFKGTVKLKNKQFNNQFSSGNFNYKQTKVIPSIPTRNQESETSTRKDNRYLPTSTPKSDNRYLPTGPSKIIPKKEEFLPIEPPILDSEADFRSKDQFLTVGPFEETVGPFQTTISEEQKTTTLSSNTGLTTELPVITTRGEVETTKSTEVDTTTIKVFTSVNLFSRNEATTTEEIKGQTESTTSTLLDEDIFISSQTSSIMQPKPFSLPTTEGNQETTTLQSFRESKLLLNPTEPTLFTDNSLEGDNITDMILTLMELAKKRLESLNSDFSTSRPGLLVPPSAGPETLHTLARYFADALESVTVKPDENVDAEKQAKEFGNDALIRALLSQMTIEKYEDLFKEEADTEATISTKGGIEDEAENDLERQSSSNPTTPPSVRQLARVFTEALAAYLEDPKTFKEVLNQVRPTEPPENPEIVKETTTADEELLNFSDQDLKPNQPRLPIVPTGIPVSPTWGYIVALNKSDDDPIEKNSISQKENLQGADSQSFVSQYNKLSTGTKTTEIPTTEQTLTTENSKNKDTIPEDHWTKSPDLTKFLQHTLTLNPKSFNENFGTTLGGLTSSETENQSTETDSDEETAFTPSFPSSEVKYELRALPKVELNSSQVHGILIDFMNANDTEGSEKMQRLLNKLNITQEEFLSKMKEIEGNPVTKRLILLLISECNNGNKELETKSASIDSVLDLIKPQVESLQTSSSSNFGQQESTTGKETKTSNHFKEALNPALASNDEDKRALQLLNSLYVIASKFGK